MPTTNAQRNAATANGGSRSPVPSPRKFPLDLSTVPRHWLADNLVLTHIANGVNLLFPVGERYFVRAVKHYLPTVTDEGLRARIRGFFGQEGQHASAHDDLNQVLRDQGFEIDSFLRRFAAINGYIEKRSSPELRLAATAALEHLTAMLSRYSLLPDSIVSTRAAAPMNSLLSWHASEEIEHKSVAFDVLQQVDPRYLRRVQGMAVASLSLATFWLWGTLHLLRQEGLSLRQLRAQQKKHRAQGMNPRIVRHVFTQGIREYLHRDFHPDKVDDYHLVERFFASELGRVIAPSGVA